MVGWRQLKDEPYPAWKLTLAIQNIILFPDLFPGFYPDSHKLRNQILD